MLRQRARSYFGLNCLLLGAGGCSARQGVRPAPVKPGAGLEPLPDEGLKVRMAAKLRNRSANDAPANRDGVALTPSCATSISPAP